MTIPFRSLALAATLAGLCGASQAADVVTLRYLSSHGGVSAHELADALGYYDAVGVELENVGYASGGPESLFALAAGGVDIGSAATPAVINAIAGGNDFVAAYPSNGINDEVQSVFYVLEDSEIQGVEDIVGKTVAVNTLGAHLDYTVREALHAADLPQDAANLVTVPGPQLEQVLRSGQVDVAAFGYWQTTFEGAARETGGIRPIFRDTDVLGEIAGGFAVLRRDFVEANPEAARNFVVGAARAADWARENPEEARAVLARVLEERGENPEIARHFVGFGLREGALPVERDIAFWLEVLEREGAIAPGRHQAADLLLPLDAAAPTN